MPDLHTVLLCASLAAFAVSGACAIRALRTYVRLDIRSVADDLAGRSRDGRGRGDTSRWQPRRWLRAPVLAIDVPEGPSGEGTHADEEDVVLTELAGGPGQQAPTGSQEEDMTIDLEERVVPARVDEDIETVGGFWS